MDFVAKCHKFKYGCCSQRCRNIKWSSEERHVAALVYLRATQDCVKGKDQSSTVFWNSVETLIGKIPSSEVRSTETIRSANAIKSFMKNNVFCNLNKFNISLNKVLATKPSGVPEEQIISMAVALHLNKATGRDYNQKYFETRRCVNYEAWLVMKDSRKFAPPTFTGTATPPTVTIPTMDVDNVSTGSVATVSEPGTGTNGDVIGDNVVGMSTTETLTVSMFMPIGQRKAKRDDAKKKNSTTKSEQNEMMRIRIALDERNKLATNRQLNQQRSQGIEDLKILMKLTIGVETEVYNNARKALVELFLNSETTKTNSSNNATSSALSIEVADETTCSSEFDIADDDDNGDIDIVDELDGNDGNENVVFATPI